MRQTRAQPEHAPTARIPATLAPRPLRDPISGADGASLSIGTPSDRNEMIAGVGHSAKLANSGVQPQTARVTQRQRDRRLLKAAPTSTSTAGRRATATGHAQTGAVSDNYTREHEGKS
jgi:hypothetical protein